MATAERVAIVGLATRFPGSGADLERFWVDLADGTDLAREVSVDHWILPPHACLDSRVPHPDSVYSTRGYFLDPFEPQPHEWGVPAELLAGLDRLFHLILDVGHRAWQSAKTADVDRRKVGVVLGNICLPTPKASELAREYLGGKWADLLRAPRATDVHPLNRYVAGLPAGLLAKSLGLGGGTFTLDAACASSLYAMKLACDELLSGRADVMLAGGANGADSQYTQMGFAQLRALSQSGKCSPFDAQADGLMVGEGAGIFVLKRLSDALQHGDTIHGVICGVGLSNDMFGNLLAPAKEGQLRAMHAAYREANWEPHNVDFVECHATGTPVGDAVEFESLRELWGASGWTIGQCGLGSVKSTVGHLLTGAGSAAVAKMVLAIANKMRPPQANFANPNPELRYANGPFRVLAGPEPWNQRGRLVPRRTAISGFGFGGVNAHLLLEEYIGQVYYGRSASGLVSMSQVQRNRVDNSGHEAPEPIAIVGMSAHFGPWDTLRKFQEYTLGGGEAFEPMPKQNGWGLATEPCPPGLYIEETTAPLDRFRIPPKELEEMLPQQVLALTAAAAALDDCQVGDNAVSQDPRTGVFVGLGLDQNTTNFHLRWAAKALLPSPHVGERESNPSPGPSPKRRGEKDDAETTNSRDVLLPLSASGRGLGGGVEPVGTTDNPATQESSTLLDAISPPLTADRTMGALGSIAASRIARAFGFGGPSFTVCSEETSAGRALELAVRALRAKELDRAIVGGVDLAGDPRMVLPGETALPGEGAAAFVLKRLSDAERAGDRIYAVIRGIGSASGGATDGATPDSAAYASSLMRACTDAVIDPATVDYLEAAATGSFDDRPEAEAIAALLAAQPRRLPLAIGAVREQIGQVGAATAAAGLAKVSLALFQHTLPPTVAAESSPELAAVTERCHWSRHPRFWLADRDTPRRAIVAATGADGSATHIVLEEFIPRSPTTSTFLKSRRITSVERTDSARSDQPLGARLEAVFAVEGDTPAALLALLDELDQWATPLTSQPIESLARDWLKLCPPAPAKRRAVTFVARSGAELLEQVGFARESLRSRPDTPIPDPASPELRPALRDRVFYSPAPHGAGGKVAFVFPGSGNQFPGQGRDLSAQWPAILRQQQRENARLRTQYSPGRFWNDSIPADTTAKQFLFGQVTLGTLTSDILVSLGVQADALIGQSLGESAGLFGLRVWQDRDEMLKRIEDSTLFGSDLGPPYDSARRHWNLKQPVDWLSGVLTVPADDVRAKLRPALKAFLLIVLTPTECVIGGTRDDIGKLLAQFSAPFFPLTGVTLAHCEAGKPVEKPYQELHTLPTTPPATLTVYSGAWGRSYKPTSANCAESITAGLLDTIDFPKVIEAAYRDKVRVFIEVGPGNSCSRLIAATLGKRPHLMRAICVPRMEGVSLVLRCVANLIAERCPANLAKLYPATEAEPVVAKRGVTIPVGLPPRELPRKPEPEVEVPVEPTWEEVPASVDEFVGAALRGGPDCEGESTLVLEEVVLGGLRAATEGGPYEPASLDQTPMPHVDAPAWAEALSPFVNASVQTQAATAAAHEVFLRVQSGFTQTAVAALGIQNELVRRLLGEEATPPPAPPRSGEGRKTLLPPPPASGRGLGGGVVPITPRSLTTEQCFEFARGKIGDVLGSLFAAIDAHPTRVRLPDGPLMLVDRILEIDGEPRSMTHGRVVTEHHVHADRWYLDAGRIPTCVAVEAGQADLFLSGFLGIDFETKGLAVYRLLDAVVTFHRGLPRIGDTIRYDIHIDQFFRQADAWLFRFRFESTVNGEPLMSMSNGVAGFFTNAALAAGQGIVHTKLDKQPMPGKKPADWRDLVPQSPGMLTSRDIDSLRRGDLVSAFGPEFAKLKLRKPMRLPSGMLELLHRVPKLDPTGGRFGMGFVRAEYDIRPDDWFLTCHFVDDMVMPGTLMYECCLHTLRVLLMRMGWIGEDGEVACEPVPGIKSRLKCRGQVIATTKVVAYEVSVKELGYGPEPYCVADALMYADGKPIVEITNMTLRMSGLSLQKLEAIWGRSPPFAKGGLRPKPLYESAKILAFSNGNPSEAFGAPYKVFDRDRVIARLPGPPYQFLDCITAVTGEPFVLKAGAACEAQYDVPRDAWYFAANRSPRMPFSVLLEIALQPCGWLAAYCGSALTSDSDLSFRNLGGKATQFVDVTPDIGTLTINVKMTNVSNSAGMIIQHYDMLVTAGGRKVYEGTTYFGFFGKEALANQVGMPQAKVPYLTPEQRQPSKLPHEPPFPAPQMRMVDRIDGYLPTGGRAGLGLVQGSIKVDPSFWFFKAHFFQDPVWPGSLGLESFLQLLKFAAWKRWGNPGPQGWQTVALNAKHEWVYRGQVVPKDKEVTVVLEITGVDEATKRLTADGFLTVDARIIYQMIGFTLE